MQEPNQPRFRRRSYPLASLFLLTTACGMLAALVAFAIRHRSSSISVRPEIAVGAVIVVVGIGALVGVVYRGGIKGLLVGGGVGIAIGLTTCFIAPQMPVLVVLLTSAGLMLVTGVLGRMRRS